MKKIFISICFATLLLLNVQAQTEKKEDSEEEETGGFKKENLFVGGTLGLGFFNNTFSFGIGPYFGYSINKYVDVAVSLNYNYISRRNFFVQGDKVRNSIIGPGGFVRIYPVKFLFAHAQYEQNFLKARYVPSQDFPLQIENEKMSVGSLLIGPGLASGRDEDNKTFYYISLLFDVAKNINSPYTDEENRIIPIVRAGFNVALFQGDGGGRNSRPNRRRY